MLIVSHDDRIVRDYDQNDEKVICVYVASFRMSVRYKKKVEQMVFRFGGRWNKIVSKLTDGLVFKK